MASISSVKALIEFSRFEQSTKFQYFSVSVLLSSVVFFFIFYLNFCEMYCSILKRENALSTLYQLSSRSIAREGFILRCSSNSLSSYSCLSVLILLGEVAILELIITSKSLYCLIMQNNQEGNSSTVPKKEPKQQSKKRENSHYDEELDEGKRVLDKLHQDYAERYEIMHKQLENQRERNRMFHERGENSHSQGFQKIDNRKMDNILENDPEKDESIDIFRNINKKSSKIFQGCNCLKSKCSKNYCECFTQGRRCNELCKCMGCENHSENEFRLRANLEGEIGQRACYCKKSNCLKKYCECYNNGAKCNSNCKCQECKNTEDIIENQRSNQVRVSEGEEMKVEPRKERSEQQVQEINNKIDEIVKVTPPEYQELMLSFLEYWLS